MHHIKENNNYLFLAMLGLCCCMGFSLVAVSRGYSLLAMPAFLIMAGSLSGAQALGLASFSSCDSQAVDHRLSTCGAWA